MAGQDEQDKDKKSSSSPASDSKTGAGSGYQFFVDDPNNAGGYSFGLGNTAGVSSPQFDTSLPDWFSTPGTSAPATYDLPAFKLPDSPVLPDLGAVPGVTDVAALPSMPDIPDLAQSEAQFQTQIPTQTPAQTPVPAPPEVSSFVDPAPAPVLNPAVTPPKPPQAPPPPPKPPQASPAPPPRQSAPPPPMPAVRKRAGEATPLPLDLRNDKRFAGLSLPAELSQTVERIFSLNDLDFNGYVDFHEITKMLEGDELTASEKQFVQLIYQVGKKIVTERPVADNTFVPVMSKDDFKLAFASILKDVMPGLANSSVGNLQAPAHQVRAFRPTVYAEEDYPLGSIKAQAVKLGTMGDACFAACLVSLIDLQPRSIMRMINVSHDQGFIIMFPGLHGKGLELMPPRAEEIVHYGLAEKYGYWYPLLEKAYGMYVAQHHKLASSLEHGHGRDLFPRVQQAMEALTNCRTGSLVAAEYQDAELKERIMSVLSKGKIVVALANEGIPQSATLAGVAPVPLKPYAVQGFDAASNKMIVRGVGTVNTSNLDESVLRLTLEQFCDYFRTIYYEKELDNATPANVELHPAKPGSNPWRKLPSDQ
ncbi:MAG: hypothetical protein JSS86_02020 [Cyanobacteria bacterium SZAS LIN-2]|nr:hypothetical protein [Cyanobacteria bacterium SZAS LIN-2]